MNMRKMLTVAAGLALAFGMAGCAKNDLQGEITGKGFEDGYSYTTFMPIYSTTCSGNPAVCTTTQTGMIPMDNYVPPCYSITVAGKTSGSTCIDQAEWEKLETGDYYEGPDVDPKDRQKSTEAE